VRLIEKLKYKYVDKVSGREAVPKKQVPQKSYGIRLPGDVSAALERAVKEGKGLNESEYIRDAIRRALREDGLLS